jgi:hypothetical protein
MVKKFHKYVYREGANSMTYVILKTTSADNFERAIELHRDHCEKRITTILHGLEQLAALCGNTVRYTVVPLH